MRIGRSQPQGSVLIICLAFSTLLGSILAGYLAVVSNLNSLSARSQAWNMAITMAESGVEEALAQINYTNNLVSNGWILSNGIYVKNRTLGDNTYTVIISNAATPVLYSTGFVACAYASNPISRQIKVVTRKNGLVTKGIAGKGLITLNGNIRVDSFNSANTNFSTGGRYDPAKFSDQGNIATDDQVINAISSSGTVTVYGHLSTGPGGTVSLGGNTTVGSKTYIQGGGTGMQTGYTNNDMNVHFPDVQAPFSGGAFTPASGTYNGTNFTYVMGAGNYQLASLSLSGQENIAITGNTVLYVTGNTSFSGQAYIYIATNASLTLYCGGASTSLAGNGIVNANGNSTNFVYYGLPSNTSISLSGGSSFTGVIYAPEASASLTGGGEFAGSMVVNDANIHGNYNFHYDENLANVGPSSGFIITGWSEY